jgi:hypothetical protein
MRLMMSFRDALFPFMATIPSLPFIKQRPDQESWSLIFVNVRPQKDQS